MKVSDINMLHYPQKGIIMYLINLVCCHSFCYNYRY